MNNYYGIPDETLRKALAYMIQENYMDADETIEDLIDSTRCMVENIPFMVVAKINEWANEYDA